MASISQRPDTSSKCETCGSDKIKARLIWLNSVNGQIYPKVKLIELIIFLVLTALSLFWFITTIVNHQNPLLMIVSVALFLPLTTISLVEGQRYLSRKKYEEIWFYSCQSCGTQWMAPFDQDSSSPD
jgi:hypothetical protein